MRSPVLNAVQGYIRNVNRWLLRTPERALNEAYEAAQRIKELEEAHFGGDRISFGGNNFSRSAQNYFQAELKKYLDIAKIRLAEFKTSSSILRISNQSITEIQVEENSSDVRTISVIDKPGQILKKLRFIDDVLARYEMASPPASSVVVVTDSSATTLSSNSSSNYSDAASGRTLSNTRNEANGLRDDSASRDDKLTSRTMSNKTGALPRSIIDTIGRIRRELDPDSEEEILQDFRSTKDRTRIAVRFILTLIIVPLLVQQLSKAVVIGPIVDQFRNFDRMRDLGEQVSVFYNNEMEEEALSELHRFEERLRFEILIGKVQPKGDEEIEEAVKEKAAELGEEFYRMGSDAVKNVFADLTALLAFTLIVLSSRREVEAVKTFIDQLVYGLSDSAKAFILILFTDIFVGFHSPHGWEVLLEGTAKHFGLPPDHNFIFLFIATFPVILDTIFKYWIFRYMNSLSPSAVATYKNMNE